MNERIRELFQEAIDYADKTHTYTPEEGFNIQVWDKIRFEKFAELIAIECAGVAEVSMPIDSHPDDRLTVKNSVLKHFGVEE